MMALLISYYILLNIYGFYLMGADKNKAKKGQWRIKESNLWLIGFIGGAIGLTIGMNAFRHKTKHQSFVVGLPALMIIHLFLLGYFLFKMS
ncbi:DUF1294 domain-containing protein [Metabacillus dongyingensis]|nr:DUF1294 domain-containing protein [Metabacillus dongyingensis]